MSDLYITSKRELESCGCPRCASENMKPFFSFGSCSLFQCANCNCDCVTVKKSIEEIQHLKLRDTTVFNLIDRHPFKKNDSMVVPKPYSTIPPHAYVN